MDQLLEKIEELTKRVDAYEKKIDDYEEKIDQWAYHAIQYKDNFDYLRSAYIREHGNY